MPLFFAIMDLLEGTGIMVWKIAAILLVSMSGLAGQDSRDPLPERLAKVKMFAFGGVGFASVATQGEKDCAQVMSRPSRQETLEHLFKTGTPEAKSYALVGLYNLNRTRFSELAATLRSSKTEVVTAHQGCILHKTTLGAVIQSIGAGAYPHHL